MFRYTLTSKCDRGSKTSVDYDLQSFGNDRVTRINSAPRVSASELAFILYVSLPSNEGSVTAQVQIGMEVNSLHTDYVSNSSGERLGLP